MEGKLGEELVVLVPRVEEGARGWLREQLIMQRVEKGVNVDEGRAAAHLARARARSAAASVGVGSGRRGRCGAACEPAARTAARAAHCELRCGTPHASIHAEAVCGEGSGRALPLSTRSAASDAACAAACAAAAAASATLVDVAAAAATLARWESRRRQNLGWRRQHAPVHVAAESRRPPSSALYADGVGVR